MTADATIKNSAPAYRNGIALMEAARNALERAGVEPALAAELTAYLALVSPVGAFSAKPAGRP